MQYWTLAFLTLTGFASGQVIINAPVDAIDVVGHDATFLCEVDFGLIETMSWEFNEAIIYSLQDNYEHYPCCKDKYSVTRDGKAFTLKVKNIDLRDGGKYTCIAMVPSATAVLIVLNKPQLSTTTLSSAEGAKAEYTCISQFAGLPKEEISSEQYPLLRMLLAGSTLSGETKEKQCEGLTNCYNITQTNTITLEISIHGKNLMCDISTLKPLVHVNVTTKITVLYSVRNVFYTPVKEHYEIGTKIVCLADGNPEPQYVWEETNIGKSIAGKILHVTEEILGYNNWRCTAKNSIEGDLHAESIVVDFTTVMSEDSNKASNASLGIGLGVTFAICALAIILTLMYCRIKNKTPTCIKMGQTDATDPKAETESMLSKNEKESNTIDEREDKDDEVPESNKPQRPESPVSVNDANIVKEGISNFENSGCSDTVPGKEESITVNIDGLNEQSGEDDKRSHPGNAHDHPAEISEKGTSPQHDRSSMHLSNANLEDNARTTPTTATTATDSQPQHDPDVSQSGGGLNSALSEGIGENNEFNRTDKQKESVVEGKDQPLDKQETLSNDQKSNNDDGDGAQEMEMVTSQATPSPTHSIHKRNAASRLEGSEEGSKKFDEAGQKNQLEVENTGNNVDTPKPPCNPEKGNTDVISKDNTKKKRKAPPIPPNEGKALTASSNDTDDSHVISDSQDSNNVQNHPRAPSRRKNRGIMHSMHSSSDGIGIQDTQISYNQQPSQAIPVHGSSLSDGEGVPSGSSEGQQKFNINTQGVVSQDGFNGKRNQDTQISDNEQPTQAIPVHGSSLSDGEGVSSGSSEGQQKFNINTQDVVSQDGFKEKVQNFWRGVRPIWPSSGRHSFNPGLDTQTSHNQQPYLTNYVPGSSLSDGKIVSSGSSEGQQKLHINTEDTVPQDVIQGTR